jgi:Cdc6-like AAA superfamily ATPase
MIAKTASDVGDIRFSFHVLLTAALVAEKDQRQTITTDDVASAIEEENRITRLQQIEALKDKLIEMKKRFSKD